MLPNNAFNLSFLAFPRPRSLGILQYTVCYRFCVHIMNKPTLPGNASGPECPKLRPFLPSSSSTGAFPRILCAKYAQNGTQLGLYQVYKRRKFGETNGKYQGVV